MINTREPVGVFSLEVDISCVQHLPPLLVISSYSGQIKLAKWAILLEIGMDLTCGFSCWYFQAKYNVTGCLLTPSQRVQVRDAWKAGQLPSATTAEQLQTCPIVYIADDDNVYIPTLWYVRGFQNTDRHVVCCGGFRVAKSHFYMWWNVLIRFVSVG
jgi:hypothetical protein